MSSGSVISIVVGSIREDSYSLRIGQKLRTMLEKKGFRPDLIDPRVEKPVIPHHPDTLTTSFNAKDLQTRISASSGIIFITPEYDGSYSSVTKVLIEHLGYPSVLAGNLVSVIGVASGRIGAHRAIDHLRSVLLHIGAVVLPGQLSLAEVHKYFGSDKKPVQELEAMLEQHVTNVLSFLPQ